MAIIMGLVTVPRFRKFPKCCMFIHPLYGRFGCSSTSDHRPWTTLLSSMGDFIVHERYSHPWTSFSSLDDSWSYLLIHGRFHCSWAIFSSMNIFLILGWFLIVFALWVLDDTFGRIGGKLIFRYPIKIQTLLKFRDIIYN